MIIIDEDRYSVLEASLIVIGIGLTNFTCRSAVLVIREIVDWKKEKRKKEGD